MEEGTRGMEKALRTKPLEFREDYELALRAFFRTTSVLLTPRRRHGARR
jgi:hypothetical protein